MVRIDTIPDLLNQNTELVLRVDPLTLELQTSLKRLGTQLQVQGTRVSLMVDNREVIPEIARLVHQQGANLYELNPRKKSLEEIFVDIIETDVHEYPDHHQPDV